MNRRGFLSGIGVLTAVVVIPGIIPSTLHCKIFAKKEDDYGALMGYNVQVDDGERFGLMMPSDSTEDEARRMFRKRLSDIYGVRPENITISAIRT